MNLVFVRLRTLPLGALCIILAVVLAGVFADVLAPHAPQATSLPNRLKPPMWLERGSPAYVLGTDAIGRDVLSRLVHGARVSLAVGALAVLLGAAIGSTVGMLSGYFGGLLDAALMRLADATLSIPMLLMALVLAVTLGPGVINLILVIGLLLWARYARVVRGETLSLRERDFVAAARINGASPGYILLHHVLPNLLNTIIVLSSLQIGWVVIVEASLSFLGAGIPSTIPSWGSMVSDGHDYVTSAWWISFFPGLAIMLTVLALSLLGDWLRDALDPKLRQL